MAYCFIIHCFLYITFTDFFCNLEISCNQAIELLSPKLSWRSANRSCTLALINNSQGVTILQQGQKAWTGKRIVHTDWIGLEDCAGYTLDSNLSMPTVVDGRSSVRECNDGCRLRYNNTNLNQRFGLRRQNGQDICVCDNPTQQPNFGSRIIGCKLTNCQSTFPEDVCGNDDVMLVYNSNPTIKDFRGSGECGAFIRMDTDMFQGLALPCSKMFGHLLDISSGSYSVNKTLLSWREKVFSNGIGIQYPSFSTRGRIHGSVWQSMSQTEWPLNYTLWVAWTRRSRNLNIKDRSKCIADKCFCVAVHNDNGDLQEELVDCNTTLPSLCMKGSVKVTTFKVPPSTTDLTTLTTNGTEFTNSVTTIKETTTAETNVTQHDLVSSTFSSALNLDGILIPVTVSALLVALVVFIITAVIVMKRRASRKHNHENKTLEESPVYFGDLKNNDKTNHGQEMTAKVINSSTLTYELAKGVISSETIVSPPQNDRLGDSNDKQYFSTTEVTKDSGIYDHTDRKEKRRREINDNEYGLMKSESGDIYDHTHQGISSRERQGSNNEINDNEYGVVKSESGDIYDHTHQDFTGKKRQGSNNEVNDNEYGVMKSECGDIYDHTLKSILQAKGDDSSNYDTMAGVRREDNNIYNHSHAEVENKVIYN